MKSDLLPRSNGDFRSAPTPSAKKLSYDEMVDIPLDRLLQIAYDDLHKNQAEFARVAKEIDPTKTPQQVLAELAAIHPAPDKLLNAFQDTFDSLIAFIRAHHIITIPSDVAAHARRDAALHARHHQASMDSPGPFETHSTKAYFNVTLPGKDLDRAAHRRAHGRLQRRHHHLHQRARGLPRPLLQFLWQPQFPSTIRKLLGANTNIEGWAHYTEQMMLDEGYAAPPADATPGTDPRSRNSSASASCRTRSSATPASSTPSSCTPASATNSTFDQAVDFFVNEGYQSRSVGLVETKRGTADATYLYYTLGKLEIMKLRERPARRSKAPPSTSQSFHDNFMRQGFAPIKIIRKAMLHDDSPVL